MSRIGKMPIRLPPGVFITTSTGKVSVRGNLGELTLDVPSQIRVQVKDNQVVVGTSGKNAAHLQGLTRSLLHNAVYGVSKGWQKSVELVGVGYRVQGTANEIVLNVGFTHPVKITAASQISFLVTDNTKITVFGPDKKLVGETAAKIRAVKPPEPYKGKGIRYTGEIVRKKAGKAVKAVGAAGTA